jgi:hypothetical protein
MSVVISTGDRLEHNDDIRSGKRDLAVLTYEKLGALVIHIPSLLARGVWPTRTNGSSR